eukprot:TRINITY_DN10633_c0_g1_i1.p1 TRINITY_DN10633_c0_g1~~TRINITY_DN10633_c0_g1_i1.p1  ORF type:complete len:79 (+),score=7.85 TRINITY_DN10633_c0_g1_i1:145-381(+)
MLDSIVALAKFALKQKFNASGHHVHLLCRVVSEDKFKCFYAVIPTHPSKMKTFGIISTTTPHTTYPSTNTHTLFLVST